MEQSSVVVFSNQIWCSIQLIVKAIICPCSVIGRLHTIHNPHIVYFQEAMTEPYPCRIYLTRILADFDCDVFLPEMLDGSFSRINKWVTIQNWVSIHNWSRGNSITVISQFFGPWTKFLQAMKTDENRWCCVFFIFVCWTNTIRLNIWECTLLYKGHFETFDAIQIFIGQKSMLFMNGQSDVYQ